MNQIVGLEDGQRITKTIRENYGHAGRLFVQKLMEIGDEELQARYAGIVRGINGVDEIQDKQRMAAAALLLADEIADEVIFKDDQGRLTFDELRPFLLTTEETSASKRAYEFLIDWIMSNKSRFGTDTQHDFYGVIEGDWAYVLKSQFDAVMGQQGFSSRAVLSAWNQQGLIQTDERGGKTRYAIRKQIDGQRAQFIAIKLQSGQQEEFLNYEAKQ